MKRAINILLSTLLLCGLCACGQKAPTWQEQYDLGVSYLSDGNYEEAIIAFTAAIEIDPKRVETYIGLSDLYLAVGNDNMFRSTLQKGYDATDSVILCDKLKSSSHFYMLYGFSFFNQLEPAQRKFISDLVDVIINGNKDLAWGMVGNIPWEENYTLYTEYNQMRIGLSFGTNSVEIRPQSGMGYYCSAGETDDCTWRHYGTGSCEDWTWNGEYSFYTESWLWIFSRIDKICYDGQMVDGLLDGKIYITGTQTWLDDEYGHERGKDYDVNNIMEYDNGVSLPIGDERGRLEGVFNTSISKDDVGSIKWGN